MIAKYIKTITTLKITFEENMILPYEDFTASLFTSNMNKGVDITFNFNIKTAYPVNIH